MKKVLKRIAIVVIVIVAAFIAWAIYGTVNYNRNGIEYVVNDAKERKINYYIGDEVTKNAGVKKYGYAEYSYNELSDDSHQSIKNAIVNAKKLKKEKGYMYVYVKLKGNMGIFIFGNAIEYGSKPRLLLYTGKSYLPISENDVDGVQDHKTYWSLFKSKGKKTTGINGLPTK